MVPVLFGVTLAVFSMLFLVPGDPVKIMLAEFVTTPDQIAQMRAQLHLDEPVLKQYGRFVTNALRGDLGVSIRSRRPVAAEITENIGSTGQLALASMLVAIGARGAARPARRARAQLLARRGRDGGGAARGGHAELLARLPADLRLLPAPRLAPRHRGRRSAPPRHAGGGPRHDRGRDHRAAHPLEHARGARPGLRADRAGQGPRERERDRAPRAPERPDPGGDRLRSAVREPAGRRGDRGDRLQPPGARPAHRGRHPGQGLPARAGDGPVRGRRATC